MPTTGRKPDPIAGPTPPPGVARSAWKLIHQLRALLGIRRSFRADGFYYKETGTELLWRALSKKGSGSKEYRLTLPPPDRSKLLLHCTPERIYADAMGPIMLPHYQRIASLIRPGMRVLDMPCNTGYGAAWLAAQVSPSGAVVAIDPETESITYAQKRYLSARSRSIAFEIGDATSLAGETDGSFDATLSVGGLHRIADHEGLLRELWRVTAPGGWMLIGVPVHATIVKDESELLSAVSRAATVREEASGAEESGGVRDAGQADVAEPPKPELLSTPTDDTHLALVRKPAS